MEDLGAKTKRDADSQVARTGQHDGSESLSDLRKNGTSLEVSKEDEIRIASYVIVTLQYDLYRTYTQDLRVDEEAVQSLVRSRISELAEQHEQHGLEKLNELIREDSPEFVGFSEQQMSLLRDQDFVARLCNKLDVYVGINSNHLMESFRKTSIHQDGSGLEIQLANPITTQDVASFFQLIDRSPEKQETIVSATRALNLNSLNPVNSDFSISAEALEDTPLGYYLATLTPGSFWGSPPGSEAEGKVLIGVNGNDPKLQPWLVVIPEGHTDQTLMFDYNSGERIHFGRFERNFRRGYGAEFSVSPQVAGSGVFAKMDENGLALVVRRDPWLYRPEDGWDHSGPSGDYGCASDLSDVRQLLNHSVNRNLWKLLPQLRESAHDGRQAAHDRLIDEIQGIQISLMDMENESLRLFLERVNLFRLEEVSSDKSAAAVLGKLAARQWAEDELPSLAEALEVLSSADFDWETAIATSGNCLNQAMEKGFDHGLSPLSIEDSRTLIEGLRANLTLLADKPNDPYINRMKSMHQRLLHAVELSELT